MPESKLPFKLWLRKAKASCYQFFRERVPWPWLQFSVEILIALTGLYLASKANSLSEYSIKLTENDSAQQEQIQTLTRVLSELNEQNRLDQQQIDKLNGIQDQVTKQNLSAAEQIKLNSELLLINKGGAKLETNKSVEQLLTTLLKAGDVVFTMKRADIFEEHNQKPILLQRLVDLLELEQFNKIVLDDKILAEYWNDFLYQAQHLKTELEEEPILKSVSIEDEPLVSSKYFSDHLDRINDAYEKLDRYVRDANIYKKYRG